MWSIRRCGQEGILSGPFSRKEGFSLKPTGRVRRRTFQAGLVVLAILGPVSARGQVVDTLPPDTIRNPVYELSGLTVVVPRPVSTTGGASAVEVVMDSLLLRPAPTLEQVLRSMPLVQIRRNSRGEAQPALRGAGERQIAVLMDGVPLTLGWDARTDLSVIPLTAAQKINMIRGLSSVLHGPNVLGGVVEIDVARGAERQTRPRPAQVDLGVDHTGGRSLGVTGGSFLETSTGTWVLRGGLGHQARDGFSLPYGAEEEAGQDPTLLSRDGDLRLNTDETRFDGFFSARYRSDTGRWLSLSTSGHTTERGVAPEAHVQDPRLWRYPNQTRLISALSGGTGQRETPWGEGDLEASIGLDLGSTEINEYATSEYREITGGEDSDDLTLTVRILGDHNLGRRGELRGALTYGDVNHDEVLDGVQSNSYRQRLWSLGGEAEWRLGGIPGIPGLAGTRLTVGLAVDGADTPETGDKPSLGTLWDWGGRLGLTTLTGNQRVLFHGAVSRRTRFPALRELYSGALGRFVPNPDLRPEILEGGELGMTVRGSLVEIQAVGFYQRLTDQIVRSSVQTQEGRKYKRINQDKVRSAGLELLGSTRLGALAVSGDLTLQRIRGIEAGGQEVKLEYEPGIMGKVSAMTPVAWGLEATAGARFMGAQYCENPEVGGLQSFDGSSQFDLGIRRVFQFAFRAFSRAEAVLNLDNVTDAVVMDQCGLPQPGRTLSLQLRFW
jgi:iron complex outermembrane receptor protein